MESRKSRSVPPDDRKDGPVLSESLIPYRVMENDILKKIVQDDLNKAITEVLRDYDTGPVTASFIRKENGALEYTVHMPKLEEKPFLS